MANDKDFKVKNGIKPTAYHEGLGTVVSGSVGYDLAGASYDSVSLDILSQDSIPRGLTFKSDGTSFYVAGFANDSIYQYDLTTAWDLSTASYASKSFSVATQGLNPHCVQFKSDGTKMYVGTQQTANAIFQYSLSTAWDVSTASYDSVSFDPTTQVSGVSMTSLFFKSDGTSMYVGGSTEDAIYQYTLSTAWDLSTASYASKSLDVSSEDNNPRGIFFKPDGSVLFLSGINNDEVFQYNLSTNWDLSTASFSNISFSVQSQDPTPMDVHLSTDGTKMFIVGDTYNTVYQYSTGQTTATLDLSTGSVFEITPTSDIQIGLSNPAASGTVSAATLLLDNGVFYDIANASLTNTFGVSGTDANPQGLAFKADGTSFYVAGNGSNTIYQYDMTTAWDVSTASYASKSLFVQAQDGTPTGIAFKPDGTRMYYLGMDTDSLYDFTLSTPWDLSTAGSTSNTLSLVHDGTTTNPHAIRFKPDGTKLFVVVQTDDTVDEWTMTTPWDIANATYSQSFSVQLQEDTPNGLAFNGDGTLMFITGQNSDTVYKYNLSTAWDVSTASYSNESVYINSEESIPEDIEFSDDGTRMYILGSGGDEVNEYSVGAEFTITYDTSLQWVGGTAPDSPALGETDVLTFATRDGGTTYQAVLSIDGAK